MDNGENDSSQAEADAHRRERYLTDMKDLADERAGRDVGRIARFVAEEAQPDNGSNKKKEEERRHTMVTAAEMARQRLAEVEQQLALMYENAARTHDGRAVFWSTEDEVYYDEDGNKVETGNVDQTTVGEHNYTWEQWDAEQSRKDALQEQLEGEPALSRTTSAARDYAGDGGIQASASIQEDFTAAVAGPSSEPDQPAPEPAPATFKPADLSL